MVHTLPEARAAAALGSNPSPALQQQLLFLMFISPGMQHLALDVQLRGMTEQTGDREVAGST